MKEPRYLGTVTAYHTAHGLVYGAEVSDRDGNVIGDCECDLVHFLDCDLRNCDAENASYCQCSAGKQMVVQMWADKWVEKNIDCEKEE